MYTASKLYSQKDMLMMFNTELRNVGLFTSLSFGLLTISRFYRQADDDIYNLIYILFSGVFLFLSIMIARYLIDDMNIILINIEDKRKAMVKKWLLLPKIVYYSNILMLLFTYYTLFRQFMANKDSFSH